MKCETFYEKHINFNMATAEHKPKDSPSKHGVPLSTEPCVTTYVAWSWTPYESEYESGAQEKFLGLNIYIWET